MKKLTNQELQQELLSKFPEYANSADRKEVYDDDGPYIYFSYFGNFLLREIDDLGDTELVKRSFDFVNEVYSRANISAEVWDLMGIELLERFELEEKYRNMAKKYLTGNALKAFLQKDGRPE